MSKGVCGMKWKLCKWGKLPPGFAWEGEGEGAEGNVCCMCTSLISLLLF